LYLGIETQSRLSLFSGKYFLAQEPFLLLTKNLLITNLNFKSNFYNLAFVKACTFSIPINGRFFWAFPLVPLFHIIPKMIIAIIAPFPPWISGLNEILRILNNCIVQY